MYPLFSHFLVLLSSQLIRYFLVFLLLDEQFGESYGPRIYQIQKQVASMDQGNQFVAIYYSKLKRLWEELNVLQPVPQCMCGVMVNCIVMHKAIWLILSLRIS